MGTFYRSCILQYLGIKSSGKDRVLDVGCYDGHFLSDYNAALKVGLDLAPVKKYNIEMIAADASFLPFKIKFDRIFAFDVMEHIPEDKTFLFSLLDALSKNGKLILITPSKDFNIFPSFLTSWLIKRWGHVRTGHSLEDFEERLSNYKIEYVYWNAPFWRFFYFPLRFLWKFAPTLTKRLLPIVARLDSKFPRGANGYLMIEIKKVPQ